jgi:PAS domain S-box-containing protein
MALAVGSLSLTNILRTRSPARSTILLAGLLVLAMTLLTATLLLDLRQRELERANAGLASLSQVLAEQTTRTFQGITLMMRSTRENLSDAIGQQLSLDSQPVTWLLQNRVAGLPQLKSMFVVKRDGLVANSSRSDFIRQLAVGERTFFRHYADGATDEIFITLPEQAKNDGAWTFYIATRLADEDGGFRGVLVAAISIEHFEALYAGIRLHFVDKIQLLSSKGMLLAGTPHDEAAFGKSGRDAFTLAPVTEGTKTVIVDSNEATGERRLIAYHPVANYPLTIGVAVDQQEALLPWRQITGPVVSGLLLLIAGVIGTTFLLVRNRVRQEALAQALQRSDEKLRQMIQSVRDAIVTVDAGGRVVLFNTAASRMFGIDAADVVDHAIDHWLSRCARPPVGDNLRNYLDEALHSPSGLALLGTIDLGHETQQLRVEVSLSTATARGELLVTLVFRDLSERQRAERELLEKNQQLEALSASLVEVRENERKRIARELHDELGQLLTGIRMEVSWLGGRLPAEQQVRVEKTAAIKRLIDQTIATVRRISSELRPLVLDDLGFSAAARWYVDQYAARTGLQVDLDAPDEDEQPEDHVATALFRILQESLTNIARHAEAASVRISLEDQGDAWLLTIRDNGLGFASDPARGEGFGLIGMRERARNLGGQLAVNSAPGAGTTIEARIPKMEEQRA